MKLFSFGWGTWIRTKEMSESEADALPLGYTPILGKSNFNNAWNFFLKNDFY